MTLEQRLIQQQIDNKEIVVECCDSGLVKAPNGNWVGFHYIEPYNRISHGYCPEVLDRLMYELDQRRY